MFLHNLADNYKNYTYMVHYKETIYCIPKHSFRDIRMRIAKKNNIHNCQLKYIVEISKYFILSRQTLYAN